MSGELHSVLTIRDNTTSTSSMTASAITITRTSTVSTTSDLTTTLGNRATDGSTTVRRVGGRRPLTSILRLGPGNCKSIMNCTSCGSATRMGRCLTVGRIGRVLPGSLHLG